MTVTISHQLGQAEARRRIDDGFQSIEESIKASFHGMVSMRKNWNGDQLCFDATLIGQQVHGRLEVLENAVQIEIDMPAMLAVVAGRLTNAVTTAAQKLLN